ncbi:hypothetical protein FACS189490_05190 [Clostridia bacterium]|nr:hypothetical protein FACS189490_05190 [Clostridia bacterium]
MQEDTASGYKEIISLCKNIDFVKQFSEPNILIDRISPALTRIFDSMAHVNIYAQSMSTVIGLFNGFVQNATLILLCLQVLYFNDGVFNLVIISIILPLYFEAVRGFVSTNLSVSNLKTNAAFIKENIESNIEHDGTKVIDTVRSIQINNPSFMIGGESKHFDVKEEFTIGDVVNVKGASGVGKSTFVKLLLSFRESEGILINNINISEISKRSLRSKITYLPQDSAILPTTIRDNISIDADISIDWESLKESPILKPVLNNKSINDIILENGTNLSGGERQRIALCRALQQDSDVFILDEIASNLDKIAAEKIYEDIMTQINDKIVFIISHDPDLSVKYNKEVVAKIV